MNIKQLILAITMFLLCLNGVSQHPYENIELDFVLNTYNEKVQQLFNNLDLNKPGLEKTKKQVEKKNYKKACVKLCNYYTQSDIINLFEMPDLNNKEEILKKGEMIIIDSLTFQNHTAKQIRTKEGLIDWSYLGPNDDTQWGNFLNRHFHFEELLNAYLLTRDEKYAKFLNNQLIDWLISNPAPEKYVESVQWRALGAGLRLKSWPKIFYMFQRSESFTDACKILMLIQVMDHAVYLQKYHWRHHNHAVMEMNGLNNIAIYWPEFANADQIHLYAMEQMTEEINREVLPDGVQFELSFLYHWVALRYFQLFADISLLGGKKIDSSYDKKLEAMYNYIAYAIKPDGTGPLNGDSGIRDFREILLKAAKIHNRPDWIWIVTNGKEGIQPKEGPSVIFPYAGYVYTRNHWDSDAHWSVFDVGPSGTSHRHTDKLHLSVSAYGNDFLVDGGRYWYRNDIWRQYFLNSYSHNVVLVDDKTQKEDIFQYDFPDNFYYSMNDTAVIASDIYDIGFMGMEDSVSHTRALIYIKDAFWVVIDQLNTEQPHNIKTLWHFHPSNEVEIQGTNIISKNTNGNLFLKSIGSSQGTVEIIEGQEKYIDSTFHHAWNISNIDNFPLQGWHSPRYNEKVPTPTAVYSTEISQNTTNAWLIMPYKKFNLEKIETNINNLKNNNLEILINTGDLMYKLDINLEKNIYNISIN